MAATAHIFRKKNRLRQPIVPFRMPKVAREYKAPGTFYRPGDHPLRQRLRRADEASLFFKVVRDHFEEFERVYHEKFQAKYGFWRPVIRSSIDKFLKYGDLKEHVAHSVTRNELFF